MLARAMMMVMAREMINGTSWREVFLLPPFNQAVAVTAAWQ
jgi:hypothetical protein